MTTYRTKDGDTLDWICNRNYGRTSGAVEAVLEANKGLADLGPIYTAGLLITLPDLPAAQQQTTIRLWD
jgi:phage tail protein X